MPLVSFQPFYFLLKVNFYFLKSSIYHTAVIHQINYHYATLGLKEDLCFIFWQNPQEVNQLYVNIDFSLLRSFSNSSHLVRLGGKSFLHLKDDGIL